MTQTFPGVDPESLSGWTGFIFLPVMEGAVKGKTKSN